MKISVKAIIFDWGRTLFDSETKKEFSEAEKILALCKGRGYRLAVGSLTSIHSNATLEERKKQIEDFPLRKYFEIVAVTDTDKDKSFDEIVQKFNLPREEILIVDDRTVRGIQYGNLRNHPTVWLQKGKFANELPNEETKSPTFIIHSLEELLDII
ncbi:MAG: HAD family hydrolase [Candidatus Taylorbacteria bacterium]|nr:HAD family hydrolase [Candidatus Taylorbacteria bacterium]